MIITAEERRAERALIMEWARSLRMTQGIRSANLELEYTVWRYQEKADEIACFIGTSRVLDWGCGSGHISYMLARRGLDVTPYDIAQADAPRMNQLLGEETVIGDDARALPFDDASFDAVVGCGVLEHVADMDASLAELRRVLRPNGLLMLYNFPNSSSYVEAVSEWLGHAKKGTDSMGNVAGHSRKMSLSRLKRLVEGHSYVVNLSRYEDLVPATLRRAPAVIRRSLFEQPGILLLVNRALGRIPMIQRIATNLTIIARKR